MAAAEMRAEATMAKEAIVTTIFSKIVRGESPAEILYQDELVTAFKDINPVAPVHILVVPNREITTADDLGEEDEAVAGRMLIVATRLAREEGIAADGYRLIINCNHHGGQVVYHLHLHLVGGRPLGPMILR
jgi:histidine triad (HIT) family protein